MRTSIFVAVAPPVVVPAAPVVRPDVIVVRPAPIVVERPPIVVTPIGPIGFAPRVCPYRYYC